MNGIQNAINAKLHDVLQYHPNQVVTPNKADDCPGQWRHEPALAAHEYRGDLRRDDCKKEFGAGIRWLPKCFARASNEQHEVSTGHKLQEHHRLQLWVV